MTPDRLHEVTEAYDRLRIAVVGDFCLDRYLEIDPARNETSIETGLTVYNVVRVRAQPGAAGTILNNLVALGVGEVIPVGFCGDDGEGYELRRCLASLPGVNAAHFLTTPERRTFTYCKPLVMEPDRPPRELNRLDSKNWAPTPESVQSRMIEALDAVAERVDAIILLDQVDVPETGVITRALLARIAQLAEDRPELRIVGDSRRGLAGWPPITLKMNKAELANLVRRTGPLTLEQISPLAAPLAAEKGREVIVTMAEDGMLGASPDGRVIHQPALPIHGEIDIVGAGDAVTANMTAALAAGCSLAESLLLASFAASVVIHKLGTTGTASREELLQRLSQ